MPTCDKKIETFKSVPLDNVVKRTMYNCGVLGDYTSNWYFIYSKKTENSWERGYKLHVSLINKGDSEKVVSDKINNYLPKIIKVLADEHIEFKVWRPSALNGMKGSQEGKFITIYSTERLQARKIIKEIENILKGAGDVTLPPYESKVSKHITGTYTDFYGKDLVNPYNPKEVITDDERRQGHTTAPNWVRGINETPKIIYRDQIGSNTAKIGDNFIAHLPNGDYVPVELVYIDPSDPKKIYFKLPVDSKGQKINIKTDYFINSDKEVLDYYRRHPDTNEPY